MSSEISDSKERPDNQNERCEEVQAIVDRMPTQGVTYVAIVVAALVVVAFALSFIISYPDTVDGNISLTAGVAPVRIVANSSGQLQLLHENGDSVHQNEPLACIQNAAELTDVLALEKDLSLPIQADEYETIKRYKDGMGEISGAFNQYLLALSLYQQHLHSSLFSTEIQNLQSQITSDQEILRHANAGKQIRREILELSSKELSKDSLLLVHKAITEQDLDRQRASYLSASESYWNTESNCATVQARIDKNEIEIKRIQVDQKETEEKLWADALGKRSDLSNQVSVWKERYLLISPVEGKLEYLSFWRDYGYIKAGEEVVTVIPKQQELFGEVRIQSLGAGKVKVGQPVNVKVNNYPYDEYGLIKGKVISISQIPSQISTKDGQVDCYLAIIHFPEGAVTNYGITLNINLESKGTAEIITKDKKLFERLFDNLKSLGTK